MALLKPFSGTSEELDQVTNLHEGYVYLTTDDQKLHADVETENGLERLTLNAENADYADFAGGLATEDGDILTADDFLKVSEGEVVPISLGGTGASTAEEALDNLGAFPNAGGVITGDLIVNKVLPSIALKNTDTSRQARFLATSDNYVSIYNETVEDSNNRNALWLSPETSEPKNFLRINNTVNGTSNTYEVYHEGNKPTLTEIGAAPSGFGLGTTAEGISNTDLLDTLAKGQSGWYRGQNVVNAPVAGWCYFEVISSSVNYSVVTAYPLSGGIYRNLYENGKFAYEEWPYLYDTVHKPTPAEIGAAPASHDASAITTGTLPIARGGTGVTANPSMLVDLASAAADTVFEATPRPGVTGTLPVANGGTGATTFTSGAALVGAGTGAVTTRTIRNNTATSGAITADTALITSNTLRYAINRTNSVAVANTSYKTPMSRGIYADKDPMISGDSDLTSGVIYLQYE